VFDESEVLRESRVVDFVDDIDGIAIMGAEAPNLAPVTFGLFCLECLVRGG
jgi:hypothetical protein